MQQTVLEDPGLAHTPEDAGEDHVLSVSSVAEVLVTWEKKSEASAALGRLLRCDEEVEAFEVRRACSAWPAPDMIVSGFQLIKHYFAYLS